MPNPIKDIAGAVGAKVQNLAVNDRLARYLTDRIGPEGIVGMKNLKTHYDTISGLISQNKQEDAMKYSREQTAKVKQQQMLDRYPRTVK